MNHSEISEHMSIARTLVEDAGSIALEYFRKPVNVEDKQPGAVFDPVTEADRRIEEVLREGLSRAFPGYSILGEEYGSEGDHELRWVIDPIDGTRAFISGVTGWGVLLGLTDGERCLGGIMHQPFLKETFVADDDEAWFHRGTESSLLNTRKDVVLSDAITYCTHDRFFGSDLERKGFHSISDRCRIQAYGGDCYSYVMLALGCIDLVVEGCLQAYDIVPLIPIVTQAGGVITNLDGETPMEGGTVIAAASEELHREAMAVMREALDGA